MNDREPSTPVAYITIGGAGSGKSTLSRRLSELADAVYLDKDTVAGPLVEVVLEALGQNPSDRESNPIYLEKVMPAEYETLFAVAGRNLQLGHSVVLDAPFVAYLGDPDFLRRSTERAQWPSVRTVVIHVRTSPAVVRQRLVQRGNERDRVKLAAWDAYWERFGSVECQWNTGDHASIQNDDESAVGELQHLVRRVTAS